jgi:hypothetical protein
MSDIDAERESAIDPLRESTDHSEGVEPDTA